MPRFTRSMQVQNHNCAWMKTLHDDLIACGLVQTSDTGQLDLSSAPAWVNTTNYNYGYTVYRWDDAQQSNYPLFLRIAWLNSADVDGHSLYIQIGQGTNGSGTLTGVVTESAESRTASGTSPTQTATAYNSYIAGDGTAIAFCLTPASPANAAGAPGRVFCMIDRLRDESGAPTADGAALIVAFVSATNPLMSVRSQYLTDAVTAGEILYSGSATKVPPAIVPWGYWSTVTSLIDDDDMPFFPYYWLTPNPAAFSQRSRSQALITGSARRSLGRTSARHASSCRSVRRSSAWTS